MASGGGGVIGDFVSPFSGLDEGAQAIHEFTQVAAAFRETVAYMPEEYGWKIELLLTDLEERQTVVGLNQSIANMSDAALRLSDTAAGLPDQTRSVITQTFDEIDESNEVFRETLAEYRAGV